MKIIWGKDEWTHMHENRNTELIKGIKQKKIKKCMNCKKIILLLLVWMTDMLTEKMNWYSALVCDQLTQNSIAFPCLLHKLFQLDTFKTSLINSPRKQAWIRSTVCMTSFKLLHTRTFTLSCPADCNTSWRACLRRSSSLFSSSNELMPCNKTNVLKQLEASCNE
jgi:hypothetical protein